MPIKTHRKRNDRPTRKRRTRKHVIADLSANHIERLALLNGFAVESIVKDYGYDLNIYTFTAAGELENGSIYVQLKATDKPRYINHNTDLSFSVSRKDLENWYNEPFPVIFILYDAKNEVAYWDIRSTVFKEFAYF